MMNVKIIRSAGFQARPNGIFLVCALICCTSIWWYKRTALFFRSSEREFLLSAYHIPSASWRNSYRLECSEFRETIGSNNRGNVSLVRLAETPTVGDGMRVGKHIRKSSSLEISDKCEILENAPRRQSSPAYLMKSRRDFLCHTFGPFLKNVTPSATHQFARLNVFLHEKSQLNSQSLVHRQRRALKSMMTFHV